MRNNGPKGKESAGATTSAASGADAKLLRAAEAGSVGTMMSALREGADIEARMRGETALMRAARTGSVRHVEALIKAGADVAARSERGTALGCAAHGRIPGAAVEALIAAGCDPNRSDFEGNTPAHALSTRQGPGAGEPLEAVLACGGDPNAKNKDAPLHIAAICGSLEAV